MDTNTFFEAIRNGNKEGVAKALDTHPGLVNSSDPKGYTPLVLAAYYDHTEIVRLLLEKGADVSQKDGTGNSALMGACFKGFEAVVEMLINAGADVNEQNAMGGTCLIYATTFNKEAIVRQLLKHGADPHMRDQRGQSALDHARMQGFASLVSLLEGISKLNSDMKELRLALVQTPLVWEDPQANKENLNQKLQELSGKADLIILPEMFTTGFTMTPENISVEEGPLSVDWMGTIASKYNAGIIGSVVFSEKGQYYNRLFFVTPDGVLSQYDKRHTFTFAGEHHKYVAGSEKVVCDFRDFRICPQICYDLRFPVWSRNTEDYDVLIYVANWPAPRIGAWDTLLKARAIENMSYCVGVNRVGKDPNGHEYPGHATVYDCLGERVAFSEEEEIIYATLNKEHIEENRQKLQFLSDRDSFILQ